MQNSKHSKHKRRDQLAIIANILYIAKEGVLKTQIMYQANLSFTQVNDYVPFMLKNDLFTPFDVDGKNGYITTAKGNAFLQLYLDLLQLIDHNSRIRKTNPAQ